MAIPSTILGKNHTITYKTTDTVVIIPFKTDAGNFLSKFVLKSKKVRPAWLIAIWWKSSYDP